MKKNIQHSRLAIRLNENKKQIHRLENQKKDPLENPIKINKIIKALARKQYRIKEQIKRSQYKYYLHKHYLIKP